MKTKLLTFLIILTTNVSFSQISENLLTRSKPVIPGEHQHDGFYLSMGLGFGAGTITDKIIQANEETLEFSGLAGIFDFKIGGVVAENLILHATLLSTSLNGPTVYSNKGGIKQSGGDISIGEGMIGAGLTYYFMPSNIFISGSLGLGNFSVIENNKATSSTEQGFSFQIKVGREWWVSRNWGLGVGLSIGSTNVDSKSTNNVEEQLSSFRFGLMFNATFN